MADNTQKRLSKLVIHSFKDKKFKSKKDNITKEEDKENTFTIPVNPESLKRNCKIELENRKAHGSGSNTPKFKSKGNEDVQFDFILDGTKTIEGYSKELKDLPVQEQLDKFFKCVYDIDGEIHKPRFLILHWGKDFKFPCQLSSLNINYTLFESNGSPLRIKISTTFVSYITRESSILRDRLKSSDISRFRIIEAGDRLDYLSYRFYNNSKFLMQVAYINELTSFRNISAGANITFPPFDKKDN